jgi:hypothetical protein
MLPRLYLSTLSSVITTGMIAWVAVALVRGRARSLPAGSARFLMIFPVILIANCVMAYPYAKREIITVAGAFYALAAFAAAQDTIDRFRQPGRGLVQTAMCVVLCGVAVAWAVRSAGVHHMIQTQAFRERLEWARLDPDRLADRTYRSDASARALASQLRQEALDMRIANPSRLPGWADRWWGE